MKDSGAEWLGKVPVTWDVAPLRFFLKLRRDIVGSASASTKLLSLTLQGVIERDLENQAGKMPASFDGYQHISAGEMVFCLFDMDETPRTVGIAPQDGMLTSAYTVFHPQSDLWARYIYYFFLHVDEYKRLRPFYRGLRKTIRPGPFLSIQVPRPTEDAARRIVSHLDSITVRIDTLVARKTRFINLLREKRQALITHAVTKGLDPNVPMKDSGVEWLGRLPAHWAIKRLKRVAMIENSGCYGADEHSDQATVRIKTCTTAHISADSRFLFESMEERFFSPAEASRYAGAPGDIFVVKSSGSNTNIISGKLARIDRNHPSVVFTNFLMRVRPNKIHVEPEFLEYFLSSRITRRRIERMVATTTYPNINVSEYASALIPIPTLEEQRSITTTINKKVSRIDTLIAKTERSIELLREHRTALITAAVTGKIDLRDAD